MKDNLVFRIYFVPSFLYFYFEKWLNCMSKKGLQLVYYKGFIYYFKIGEPSDRMYFIYNCTGYRKDDGKFSVSLRYPCLEKQYAVTAKLSKLNKLNKKYLNSKRIIEIDKNRVDIGFNDIVQERNKIYFKKSFRDLLIFLVALLSCFFVFR